MFDGFIVRFVRKDDQPAEEYFYHSYEEAHAHFALFLDDDSGLYKKIEIIQEGNANTVIANVVLRDKRRNI